MLMKWPTVLLFATLLHACDTSKSIVDVTDDYHCTDISFYFSGLARYVNAPIEQQLATKKVFEWYANKLREKAASEGADIVKRRLVNDHSILDAVKKDPNSMTDELEKCSTRAQKSAGFAEFAATISL